MKSAHILAICTFVLAAPAIAQSNDPDINFLALPGADLDYPYKSQDQPVGDALRYFARNLRVAVKVDDSITGTILSSDDTSFTREQYLDELAEEFNFVWYFDGIILHIVDIASFETEAMPLQNNDGTDVIAMLQRLDVYQEKFMHRADLKSQTLLVMGPPDYVDIVRSTVEAIERAERKTVTLLRGTPGGNLIGSAGLDPAASEALPDLP